MSIHSNTAGLVSALATLPFELIDHTTLTAPTKPEAYPRDTEIQSRVRQIRSDAESISWLRPKEQAQILAEVNERDYRIRFQRAAPDLAYEFAQTHFGKGIRFAANPWAEMPLSWRQSIGLYTDIDDSIVGTRLLPGLFFPAPGALVAHCINPDNPSDSNAASWDFAFVGNIVDQDGLRPKPKVYFFPVTVEEGELIVGAKYLFIGNHSVGYQEIFNKRVVELARLPVSGDL